MKILLKTESSNPDFNADCECAMLDVTPELAQQIKARVRIARQAAKADSDLWELYFWGPAPTFHGYDLIEACAEAAVESSDASQDDWEQRFEDQGFLPIPETVDVERFEPKGTECDQEIIRCERTGKTGSFEVAWTMIPKHTDIYITTKGIPVDRLAVPRTSSVRETSP